MKKSYETPMLDVRPISADDVIRTSGRDKDYSAEWDPDI